MQSSSHEKNLFVTALLIVVGWIAFGTARLSNDLLCGVNAQLTSGQVRTNATSLDYTELYSSNLGCTKKASELEFPWHVRLEIYGPNETVRYRCGGAVLDRYWVITSARCARLANEPSEMVGIFGLEDLHKLNHREFAITAAKIVIHGRFSPSGSDFDFALIKMAAGIKLADVQPVCLPASCSFHDNCKPGELVVATGWGIGDGRSFDGSSVPQLRKDALLLLLNKKCKVPPFTMYNKFSRNKLCVRSKAVSLPNCAGDEGGPLVCLKKLTHDAGTHYFFQLVGITTTPYHSACLRDYYTSKNLAYQGFGKVCAVIRWIRKVVERDQGILQRELDSEETNHPDL